jgi:ssRNA-specific RNase YbeY (16S rRNA maturation enzyme)
MAHGILHCLGYKDKSAEDALKMRGAEDKLIQLFHVEHNSTDNVC